MVADRKMNCWENASGRKRRMIQNVGDAEFKKYIGFQSTVKKNLNRKKKKKNMKERRAEWSEGVKERGKDEKGNEEQILTSEYMILKYKHMGKAKRLYTCVLRVRSVLIFFSKAALRILISSSFFNLYSVNKLYKMSYIICH